MSNQPVHSIRIGFNSIAIFPYTTQSGKVLYNAQMDRSYKDGDEWKHTHSFGLEDLCVQTELIDQAKKWILQRMEADAKELGEPTMP